jgi:hypothetical protein
MASSHQLNLDQAAEWVLKDITYETNWDTAAGQAPAGWDNNRAAKIVATVMVQLELGNYASSRPSLQNLYLTGYKTAHLTLGFHQRQNLICFALGGSYEICHLTFRLYKAKGTAYADYKAVHIYVTRDGRIGGATLWDEQNNRAIS